MWEGPGGLDWACAAGAASARPRQPISERISPPKNKTAGTRPAVRLPALSRCYFDTAFTLEEAALDAATLTNALGLAEIAASAWLLDASEASDCGADANDMKAGALAAIDAKTPGLAELAAIACVLAASTSRDAAWAA